MNWIDILILLFLIIFGIYGKWRGFFHGFLGMVSTILGFLLALFFYRNLAFVFVKILNISYDLADLISLIFLLFLVTIVLNIISERLIKTVELKPSFLIFDKIMGVIFGIISGLLIVGGILILLSSFSANPKLNNALKESFFTIRINRFISSFYQKVENQLSGKIPRLIKYPEESLPKQKYQEIISATSEEEWQELDGATCFACGGKVKYMGIKKHILDGEEIYSPYYVCPNCGRHSDSCQSYEGYHKLYGECPAILAKKGVRFDCGMWPNGNFVKPIGTCPVCDEVAEHHEHEHEHKHGGIIWPWDWVPEYKLTEARPRQSRKENGNFAKVSSRD